jgi:hypothetical protein
VVAGGLVAASAVLVLVVRPRRLPVTAGQTAPATAS